MHIYTVFIISEPLFIIAIKAKPIHRCFWNRTLQALIYNQFFQTMQNFVTITLKTTKLLIFEYGWGRRTSCQACYKPTRVQSCSMHAISRYCEIMPKIIDFYFVCWLWKEPLIESIIRLMILGRAYIRIYLYMVERW